MAQKGLAFAAITLTMLDKEITRTLALRDPPPFITDPEVERILDAAKDVATVAAHFCDLRDGAAFERPKGIVASLEGMAPAGQFDLLYFDESGFSSNSPLQYGQTVDGPRPSLM